MNRAFSSEECVAFERAMEIGWDFFLKAKRLTVQNRDVAKGALAYAILECSDGENVIDINPRALAMHAVARMAKYEVKLEQLRPAFHSLSRTAPGLIAANEPIMLRRQMSR